MNVIESIYNEPEKWRQTQYTFMHECGAEIWTANMGIFDHYPYPSGTWPLSMKIRFWWARRWWMRNAPVTALGRERLL